MNSANLAGLIDGPARWNANGAAVTVGERIVRRWGSFATAVARRAGGLKTAYRVRRGSRVAIFSDNCEQYLEVLFSIWHAGAVAVPINSRLHPREAAVLLEDASAEVCFVGAELSPQALSELNASASTIRLGGERDDALLEAEAIPAAHRGFADDAWVFYTSGTTGRAKGAQLSHGNLLAMAAAYYADVAAIDATDAIIHAAALSHASGLFAIPFAARGAEQVLPASGRFDIPELADLLSARRRSTLFASPTMLRRMNAAGSTIAPVSERIGLVLVGGAPALPEDLRAGVETIGPRIWNGYGQGESPCTIAALDAAAVSSAAAEGDLNRLGSVGTARWSTTVRVHDAEDRPVAPGEIGEVVVAGPTVMSGYLGLAEATERTLRAGWLHTGDLGCFDDEGILTLVGRAKDVVITGGYNVYPREVEAVLAAHDDVEDVAVIGLPDPEWGERVAAVLVPVPGSRIDEAALDASCLNRIARHKRPKQYFTVAELPRNSSGKVDKRQLIEDIARGS